MASASAELQRFVVETLLADAAVAALVTDRAKAGNAVGGWPFPYVTVQLRDVLEDDAEGITGRNEIVEVHSWSRSETECARLADAAKDALHRRSADLETHSLVDLWFVNGINVGDPDGITEHRVSRFEALVEEA